jgi:hypothetical protein
VFRWWRSEKSQDKDGDAGNVLHFRSSRTQYCDFAVAKSEQKNLKRSKRMRHDACIYQSQPANSAVSAKSGQHGNFYLLG